MALNYIWIFFFAVAFIVGLIKLIFTGDTEIFPVLMQSIFDNAETGFKLSLGLTGVLALWLGIMKIGEDAGVIRAFARVLRPLFRKIFPDIPDDHPAIGSIVMNISANMLGLDNAATPMGLKAMKEMQELNSKKDTASNAQILFLVLNTSGLTLIPISIMVYRAQLGAADPTDIFIPILLATFFSTIVGLITIALFQKINLFDKVILAYLGGMSIIIGGIIYLFKTLPQEQAEVVSQVSSNLLLFIIIMAFIVAGVIKKVNVYESFIEGAKEGFKIAIKIIPYLIGILIAIGVFRASGAMGYIILGVQSGFELVNINTDFVDALPTAFMKPLSGSGARGMMIDAIKTFGPDSFVGRLVSTIQGSTDTTFYILAVYFGSVGIKKTRYAVSAGLIADLAGIIAAIFIAYMFWH
ncbi:MAG: nucleoside recognition domain-containing protein [Bacteroidota bacterium]|nr:nucleoside recognition domain-containing protein [Bacteroidota bacterium]